MFSGTTVFWSLREWRSSGILSSANLPAHAEAQSREQITREGAQEHVMVACPSPLAYLSWV